jgi:hypothetical protein
MVDMSAVRLYLGAFWEKDAMIILDVVVFAALLTVAFAIVGLSER